jgi:hypothetical protein
MPSSSCAHLLCPRPVDPVHQSPRPGTYGYFPHGTVPPSRPYSSGLLFLPNRLCRLPSPIHSDCRWLGYVTVTTFQVLPSRPSPDRASPASSLSLIGPFTPECRLPRPTFGRPVHLRGSPHRLRPGSPPHAFRIPSRDGHPALRRTPFLLRPTRHYPRFGYGPPHPSARRTSTFLNNATLSTHYARC